MPTFNDKQRKAAVRSRLQAMLDRPKPDYPEPRKIGRLVLNVNGKRTTVILEPYIKNITQWRVTINGVLFNKHCGMSKVYEELARLNPPARNFY